MKKMPKMLKGCSPKKTVVTSDEKLFWAPKQDNHSLLLCTVETAMHLENVNEWATHLLQWCVQMNAVPTKGQER
jgi:hypothetical protein